MTFDRERTVAAWDLPTRLFHWALVLIIVTAWASYELSEEMGDSRLTWHRWNGLLALVLIVWRLLWGIVGPRRARFSSFVRGPGPVLAYARDLGSGRTRRYLGHNPLGSIMVLALIAVVMSIGLLGLFAVEENDLATGPLYPLAGAGMAKVLTGWHRFLFEPVLILLIVVHVAANVLYGVLKKDPLIAAMVTGRKPAGDYEDAAVGIGLSSATIRFRAFACLAGASLIVFGGIAALGGRLPPWPSL